MSSNYMAMVKVLSKRANKPAPSINGKVWSEEMEAYLTMEEAIASGHGKSKRSKLETLEFNCLLLAKAEQKALKAKKVKINRGVDREVLLNTLVDVQERMAKGMKLAKEAKEKQVALQAKLDDAKSGNFIPREQFMAIVEAKRSWKDRESLCWDGWWVLQAESAKIAAKNNLWADFFKLCEYSPSINSAGETRESNDLESFMRTTQENDTGDILADTHQAEWSTYIENVSQLAINEGWNTLKKGGTGPGRASDQEWSSILKA